MLLNTRVVSLLNPLSIDSKQVGFLGVVIGPEGIKMKEEKIKGVLNWLTP